MVSTLTEVVDILKTRFGNVGHLMSLTEKEFFEVCAQHNLRIKIDVEFGLSTVDGPVWDNLFDMYQCFTVNQMIDLIIRSVLKRLRSEYFIGMNFLHDN